MPLPPPDTLAVSSWSWHAPFYEGRLFLHDVPREAAQLGFQAVELNDFMLAPARFGRVRALFFKLARAALHVLRPATEGERHPAPPPSRLAQVQSVLAAFSHRQVPAMPDELLRYTHRNLRRVREALDESNVRCTTWTVNSDFCVPDTVWAWQERYLRWGLAATEILGATHLRLTLGGNADASPETEAQVVERLAALARYAHTHHPTCQLVVENHWGISTEPARLLRILDTASERAGHPIGLCFDPGNLPPDQREAGWALLAPRASHLHFKTFAFDDAGNETTFPYEQILPLVNPACDMVTIEFEGDGDPATAVKASRTLYTQLVFGQESSGKRT